VLFYMLQVVQFFKNIFSELMKVYARLDTTKKIITAGILLGVLATLVGIMMYSGSKEKVLLWNAELSPKDFGKITKKLDEWGYEYTTSGTNRIYVNKDQKEIITTRLAQENLIPADIPGWKLFDVEKWTTTQFEREIKYRRALQQALKKHIESLDSIEKAYVEIAITKPELYTEEDTPYTASVIVTPAPQIKKLPKKIIKGIQLLVARAVGKLSPDNVTVVDNWGNVISDFDTEEEKKDLEMWLVRARQKFKDKVRARDLAKIRQSLERVLTPDRVEIVNLDYDIEWDEWKEKRKEYYPIVMQEDDPRTPYNERKVKDSLTRSEKTVVEKFKGHGWNPEGPAGTEGNVPPGYKMRDDQYAEYSKKEIIKNEEVNERQIEHKKDPFDVKRKYVSVIIDVQWKKEIIGYRIKRTPIYLTPKELKDYTDIIKAAIGYNPARGDVVVVKNIMFDRTKEFQKEDEELRKKEALKKTLLATLVALLLLFVALVVYRAIAKEIERRRRLKEEELAEKQRQMQEAALRAAEEGGVEVELSLEERARLELQENAINLARERPEDVAMLIRTWLSEE